MKSSWIGPNPNNHGGGKYVAAVKAPFLRKKRGFLLYMNMVTKGFITILVNMVRRLTRPASSHSIIWTWNGEIEMKKAILLLASGMSALALIGCANTSANLQRETARSIGGISSEQVTVHSVQGERARLAARSRRA